MKRKNDNLVFSAGAVPALAFVIIAVLVRVGRQALINEAQTQLRQRLYPRQG